VLGSTGSIGRSALEVIAASDGDLNPIALSAHGNTAALIEQARRFRPRWVIATDEPAAARQDWSGLPEECELLTGADSLSRVVSDPQVDIVLAAIVGRAGLQSTLAAVEAGKTIALANKETLVIAGAIVIRLAAQFGALILPVDSEHSAIFQAMQAGRREEVRRIVLTASGGPFLRHTPEQLARVTVEEALRHPNWNMGPKVTVDSATMMNKALEIIEARWLFDLAPEQIDVVVHPQSIVHSLVEFVDGSVIAQMSPPDMKLPIQYALTYPRRRRGPAARLDLSRVLQLDFQPPDLSRFEALELGWQAARAGGTTGAVLNAANEAAVERFLAGGLPFARIVSVCRIIVEHHPFEPDPSLARLLELDAWALEEVLRWDCT
jgi:1-deoxy-D-xylulose-5-phosphate reductoisomerase